MADAKITSLAALAADPANNDMFVIVDVSDTSMASTGTDKKLAASYLMKASAGATFLLADGSRTGATAGVQSFTGGVRADGGIGYGLNPNNALTLYSTTADFTFGATIYNQNTTGTAARAGFLLNNNDYNALFALNGAGVLNSGFNRPHGFLITNPGPGGMDFAATNAAGRIGFWAASALALEISATRYVGVQEISPTAVLHIAASTATRAQMRLAAGTVPTAPNDGDIARGTTGFTLYNIDSGTNAVINHVIANRQSSGTPAAGFGVGFAALLESSTTVDQNAGRLTFAWSTATHASRAAVGKLTAYYTSTEREAITWTADSASVTVSIAGNTQATGSVQVTGSAFASHTGGKSFNAQGAGYDGTRFWSGYVGLGAYWDATNWKTGTDGGSNGASLIIGQGSGDDLSFYTMTATGPSQQTIAHGSLASSLRLTLNASYAAFTGSVRSGYDTNLTSYFGRAAIGYNGSTSDVASFGHIDMNTSANIALFQTAAGESWFNCASGQNLIFARGGFSLGQWDTSGNLHPAVDNTVDCGKSGSRWNDIWASNATIQTSDQRDKKAIKPSALGLDFVKALQPMSWVWADKGKRPHYGFIAQQVKQAMDAVGVDDFAGYIYDEETDSYSLRYSEFLSPIVKALQELLQRVERLEKAN